MAVEQLHSLEIEIADLKNHPQYVSSVAAWHHQEWLSGYRISGRTQAIIDRDISEDARDREHNLRTHFDSAAVPVTFIAIIDDNGEKKAIGSISLVYFQFSKQRKPTEWVTNLFVLEEYRNQGVGDKLLAFITQYAADNNIEQIKLYTRDKADFYRKRDWDYSHKGLVQGNAVSVLIKTLP